MGKKLMIFDVENQIRPILATCFKIRNEKNIFLELIYEPKPIPVDSSPHNFSTEVLLILQITNSCPLNLIAKNCPLIITKVACNCHILFSFFVLF